MCTCIGHNTPTCYYVFKKKNYTTLSECNWPIVPEINFSN